MLVSDAMTRHPIMISKETSASEARRIMTENNIRHLPVASSGKILEGLVTRQSFSLEPEMVGSLDVWDISRFLSGLNVANIMIKADMVHTIGADKTIERAARTMSEHKVGSLPVIEDGVVVGILTDVDVLNAIQNMLGMPEEGIRVTIRMPDRPGEFVKLTTVMGEQDGCRRNWHLSLSKTGRLLRHGCQDLRCQQRECDGRAQQDSRSGDY